MSEYLQIHKQIFEISNKIFDLYCELNDYEHDDPFTDIPMFMINIRSRIVENINKLIKEREILQTYLNNIQ